MTSSEENSGESNIEAGHENSPAATTTSAKPNNQGLLTHPDSEQKSSPARFPVVGIGASAGGLEAFTGLLKALPADTGMAFVLVPHLDPNRESSFARILAHSTSMSVVEVLDNTPVKPNHVYIIPPNCDLTIVHSRLHIKDQEGPRAINKTIDIFFFSLAEDQGNNAIGIVLSGTASDGTLGLTAIKAEGGITFAQDETSAKYNSMPANAIAAGCVDFVLPPESIAQELVRIRQHPYVAGAKLENGDGEDKGADVYMGQVFRMLRRITHVDFSEYKQPTIARRIQRRMVLRKINKLGDYVALLHRNRNEVAALYQDLLINVTSFFRNPDAFDALKRVVYPAILKAQAAASAPIRIWVPGCSTGEETYSHAMSLMEFLGEERIEVPIQIFGTDLSESAIQHARAGIYKENIETDVGEMRLRRFFHKVDGNYQINKTVRDLCIFSTHNAFNDPPFSRMDLISCRNVMIYLGQSLQKKVIPIFHYALNPTGFLMIGNTEGLLGTGAELFEMADKKQKIYRKRSVTTPVTFGFAVGQSDSGPFDLEIPSQSSKVVLHPMKAPLEVHREADRLLLSRYAPPSVVVNDRMEILQSRGHTGAYLELPSGKATLNLLKMARPGLLFELQSAIEETRKTGLEAERHNILIDQEASGQLIAIHVVPFRTPIQEQHSFLVIFEPTFSGPDQLQAKEASLLTAQSEPSENRKQIAQLMQELTATKEYLQSIIETQESTNEELQSANEEIQSGNEELQTSREELESANEELHTVNEEMQHRNEQLTQLNNDLTNLLNSINLPMVMMGSDLEVRRFTPQATTMLGLVSTDIGRPIPRLKLKIDVRDLKEIMLQVIQDVQVKQYQVEDYDGRWFTLRLTPYRTLDNRIDGVVLTVVDWSAFEESSDADSAKKTEKSSGKSNNPKTKK